MENIKILKLQFGNMENKTIKIVLITTVLVSFILLFTCYVKVFNKNDNITCECEEIDYEDLPFSSQEYFILKNKKDTSAYSFIFTEMDNHTLLEIFNSPYYKYYMIERESDLKDTTAISNGEGKRRAGKYYSLDYPKLLSEFEQCLFAFSKNNNINKLKSIKFRLGNMTNLAITTTNTIMNFKNIRSIKHQDIDDALKKTSLNRDLNKILNNYNLKIKSIHCQEEIYLIDRSTFMNVSLIKPDTSVPPHIVDVEILVKIDRSETVMRDQSKITRSSGYVYPDVINGGYAIRI